MTVNQTLTTITVSPASVTLNENQTQQFTATAKDQFGTALVTQPVFTWAKASGVGSIDASGLYTAPAATGSASITATSGLVVGSAAVTVSSAPPTAAAATPSPVTGTTTALSVLGADDGGESNLTYTWATTGTPPAAVNFSVNGTNGAKNSTATFSKAGSYTFQVTITDAGGSFTTSTVGVTVNLVNQAPSFTKGADQTIKENAGAQTVVTWATAIAAGPPNESSQTLNFLVNSTNTSLFSVQPAIAANGTLSYTPAQNASGASTVTVQLHDSGGTANGGVDTSAMQTFTIIVTNPAAAYQNQSAPVDVNQDANVTPLDALIVINDLINHGVHVLPTIPPALPIYYLDVNGDGSVTPNDALIVINDLLSHGGSHALPSASSTATPLASANGSGIPAPAAIGDPRVASALVSSSATSIPTLPNVPPWISYRLIQPDLNHGLIAKYFEHLADENTAEAKSLFVEADQLANEYGLDDELLDSLVVGLTL